MYKMRKELQGHTLKVQNFTKAFVPFQKANKIFVLNFHLYTQGVSGCAKAYVKLSAKDLEECCGQSI